MCLEHGQLRQRDVPVPKSRHTKSKRDRRRAHIFLKEKALVSCGNCGAKILSHRACPECGYYKSRMVINIAEKEKKEKAGAAKEGSGPASPSQGGPASPSQGGPIKGGALNWRKMSRSNPDAAL